MTIQNTTQREAFYMKTEYSSIHLQHSTFPALQNIYTQILQYIPLTLILTAS
jgi:hypothetical protein